MNYEQAEAHIVELRRAVEAVNQDIAESEGRQAEALATLKSEMKGKVDELKNDIAELKANDKKIANIMTAMLETDPNSPEAKNIRAVIGLHFLRE